MKILGLILLFAVGAQARELKETRESYVFTAWDRLPKYISFCLQDSSCALDAEQKSLLTKIQASIAQEKDLIITTEQEQPGLFSSVGTHLFAVTGDKVGSQIYINRAELMNVDYPTAIALLVHELGHHQGVKDTDDRVLDILGAKVKQYIFNRMEKVTLVSINQAHIGQYTLNSPDPKYNEQYGSEALLYDDTGIYDEAATLNRWMRCPLGNEVKGGLILSQLRESGLTDWQTPSHKQAAVLEYTLKLHCVGPQEDSYTWMRIRQAVPMVLPEGTVPREDWWKTVRAQTGDGIDIMGYATGVGPDLQDNRSGAPLEIQQLQLSQTQIANGETLKVSARVRTPMNLPIEACSGLLSSKAFLHTPTNNRYKFDFNSCELKDIGGGIYDLSLSYTFPKVTESREYFLDSLRLHVKGKELMFVGVPDQAATITLKSSQTPKPLKLVDANLVYRDASGKPTILAPTMNPYDGKIWTVPTNSIFGITLYIQSESDLNPESKIIGNYDWMMGTQARQDAMESYAVSTGEPGGPKWNFPFGGSTVIQKAPDGSGLIAFQLALRPNTIAVGNRESHLLKAVRYDTLWLINENLQELYRELNFEIQAK